MFFPENQKNTKKNPVFDVLIYLLVLKKILGFCDLLGIFSKRPRICCLSFSRVFALLELFCLMFVCFLFLLCCLCFIVLAMSDLFV